MADPNLELRGVVVLLTLPDFLPFPISSFFYPKYGGPSPRSATENLSRFDCSSAKTKNTRLQRCFPFHQRKVLRSIFAGYVPPASQNPYPILAEFY